MALWAVKKDMDGQHMVATRWSRELWK